MRIVVRHDGPRWPAEGSPAMAASARGGHRTSRGVELGCRGGRRARVNIWWVVWAVIWDSSGLELANKKIFRKVYRISGQVKGHI
jgi:hypothetical protein